MQSINQKTNDRLNKIANELSQYVAAKVDTFPISPMMKILVIAKIVTGLATSLLLTTAKNVEEEEKVIASIVNDLKTNLAANKEIQPSNGTVN